MIVGGARRCLWSLGRHLSMHLVEFAVYRCLSLQVLTVQPFDELMSRLLAPVVGMMAIAEQELAARRSPREWARHCPDHHRAAVNHQG